MDLELEGRAVLITGASQGLGRAIAEAFARERCSLHLVARGEEGLAAVRAELVKAYGVKIETKALDMAAPGASEAVAAAFPEIDILVNNAGAIGTATCRPWTRRPGGRPGTSRCSATSTCRAPTTPPCSGAGRRHRERHRARGRPARLTVTSPARPATPG